MNLSDIMGILEDPEMQELLKNAKEMEDRIARRNDDDYIVNQEQWTALIDAFGFFSHMAEQTGGKVEMEELRPREKMGRFSYIGRVFEASQEEVTWYCRGISHACAILSSALPDGNIEINVAFANVFIRKDGYPDDTVLDDESFPVTDDTGNESGTN